MVPVSPDMSNMIPTKLTGKPFWEVYLYENPPLWVAYIEAVKRYKIDGWSDKGYLGPSRDDKRKFRTRILKETQEAITTRTNCKTPAGELWCETVYYRGAPPWVTRKYIKDLEADFECLKYFYPHSSSMGR